MALSDYMTKKETAALLRISENHLMRLVKAKRIPCTRIAPRSPRFNKKLIERYLEAVTSGSHFITKGK